ncbi:unnamed protein product [Mycena citricolor]|uniref:Uncharacterized protein n=1 Tax=Mycena citricolor TaxID=2018698 RepID=A0AAD2GV84_9AGAR|nr:unnamed protein product [Mycena citricolor]
MMMTLFCSVHPPVGCFCFCSCHSLTALLHMPPLRTQARTLHDVDLPHLVSAGNA